MILSKTALDNEYVMTPFIEALVGVPKEDWHLLKSANEALDISDDRLNANVLKAAALCLRQFPTTEKSASFADTLEVMSETVSSLHSDVAYSIREKHFSMSKEASTLLDTAKTLFTVPVLTGGIAGGALWALRQHTKGDSAKNEALKTKIRYFRTLSKEIEEDIANKYPDQFVSPDAN